MPVIDTSFESLEAPCGRTVAGVKHQDRDEECLLTEAWYYDCGCRRIRHQYHDGTFSRSVVHHDGTVLADELFGAE